MNKHTPDGVLTRSALLKSRRYLSWVAVFDTMAMANVPPMQMDGLSPDEHKHVRDWAIGASDVLPPVMQRYADDVARAAQALEPTDG